MIPLFDSGETVIVGQSQQWSSIQPGLMYMHPLLRPCTAFPFGDRLYALQYNGVYILCFYVFVQPPRNQLRANEQHVVWLRYGHAAIAHWTPP